MSAGLPSITRAALARFRSAADSPRGALERGAALGTGADDLGERAAHLPGEDHVADLDRVHLDAERFASARDLLEQPLPDLELALEHVVDARLGHRRPEGQLRDDIELVLVALGLVERPRRIGHAQRDDGAEAQVHVVAGEDLLRLNREQAPARVHPLDPRTGPQDPVATGLEHSLEAALHVQNTELRLVDSGADHVVPLPRLAAEDHRRPAGA